MLNQNIGIRSQTGQLDKPATLRKSMVFLTIFMWAMWFYKGSGRKRSRGNCREYKNNYLGLIEFKQVTLLSLYAEHNAKMEALVGKTYAFSTLQKHLTTLEHLKDFLEKEYKSGDIIMEKVNTQFLLDFEFYLKTEKSISNNTTIKYMKNLGK